MIKFSQQLFFNTALLLLLVYFVFHSIYGTRGIKAYSTLTKQLVQIQHTRDKLIAERVELEHHAKLLKSGDRDFLDEKARYILGVANAREQIFSTTQHKIEEIDEAE